MIKNVKFGSIFNCKEKHVIFAINKEGISDSTYTKKLVNMGFNELEASDSNKLGSVISKNIGDKTYHAISCYSLRFGWENAKEYLHKGLDNLNINEDVAIVEIGNEPTQKALGADYIEMKKEMQNSSKKLVLYKEV